jgi:hypothetical protein
MLGDRVAVDLIRKIRAMGLRAERAGQGSPPMVGDALITGQFISIDKGDRTKRVVIGFGKGSGELLTYIEGVLVTPKGYRLLGSREVETKGGKKPGLALPAIIAVATDSPVGLIVNSALTVKGEKKGGGETWEGAADGTADEIAKELKRIFQGHGWI